MTILFLVPKSEDISYTLPPGLEIVDNFITEEEEILMLQYFKDHWSESSKFLFRYLYFILNFIKMVVIFRFNETSTSEALWL